MADNTRVVHVNDHVFGAVYIGRAVPRRGLRRSKWANPYKIGWDGTREQVIAKYRAYVTHTPALMSALHELKNRPLACWCAPEPCHGDVLVELVRSLDATESEAQ